MTTYVVSPLGEDGIPYAAYSGADLTLVGDPEPTELEFAVLMLS